MPTHQSPDTHGMTYRIVMNEHQRKLIELALDYWLDCIGEEAQQYGVGSITITDLEEAQILYNMTRELPDIEKEHPRTLHGFCL
jgi:hypothetical protein